MGMDVLSPFSFYGGKARMAPLICRMLDYDNTDIYIEPFGGACRVLLNKPRHGLEIYNDYGIGLYEFFSCMSRPELSEKVISALYDIIPGEEVFHEMRDYKIEHESELTDYMQMQFKKFICQCNRKYKAKELGELHRRICQKKYEDIINISRGILTSQNVFQDIAEVKRFGYYVELYEAYWEIVCDEYQDAYAKTKSHERALNAIEGFTSDVLISNGSESTMDSVKMAVATFASYYMSRDGMGLDYSEAKCRSMDAYYRQLARLEEVAERMEGVEVSQLDAMLLTRRYCQDERAMIYLDPSYLNPNDTGKDLGKGIYNRSSDYALHKNLLEAIQDAKAHIIISNYEVPLYDDYLDKEHGWRRMEFPTKTSVGSKKDNLRTEVLWYNY